MISKSGKFHLHNMVILCVVFNLFASSMLSAKEPAALVIPDYSSAKDQFGFALMYEKSQFAAADVAKRKGQVDKFSQCYQRVIDNFPQDTEYTPRAYLHLGDCQAKISEPDNAMKYYYIVLNGACTDEYLQARALFSVAQMLEMKKDFANAKNTYKEVMDRFGTSQSGAVREITKRASALYFQVREQPAPKKKWSLPKLFGSNKQP